MRPGVTSGGDVAKGLRLLRGTKPISSAQPNPARTLFPIPPRCFSPRFYIAISGLLVFLRKFPADAATARHEADPNEATPALRKLTLGFLCAAFLCVSAPLR